MEKYSLEFKVVKYCLEEHHSYLVAARHFSVSSPTTILLWVRKYLEHGYDGLVRNSNISYSGQFKINVVEYMHKNHLSLTDTAIHFNLSNHTIVGKWERIYYEEGPQALCKERRVRCKNMNSKPRKKKLSIENEKDLIAEIQQLRMENAYLKKLNALVQERIKRENPKK